MPICPPPEICAAPAAVKRQWAASVCLRARRARVSLLDFLRYTWWQPHALVIGEHTRALCQRLDAAVEALDRGESTFLTARVPFRHGKSDIFSRALPAYFLGRFADAEPDVLMSGYGAALVEAFSRRVQQIICNSHYPDVFPAVRLALGRRSASNWAVDYRRPDGSWAQSAGEVIAAGIGGAITGRGGSLVVVDDFIKTREEAESRDWRDKVWDSFRDQLMTRRAPAAIVAVVGTPWHEDDLFGRIRQAMADDAEFPRFEDLSFPARHADGSYLFPERYSDEWYRGHYATLGPYSAAALLDMEPRPRSESRFFRDWFSHYDAAGYELPTGGQPARWRVDVDFASGQGDEHCESAILVHAVDGHGRRYFHRLIHGRMPPERLVAEILGQVAAVRPDSLGLERGGAAILAAWLRRDLATAGLHCRIVDLLQPAGSGAPQDGAAKLRIESLAAPYAAGLISHNAALGSEQVFDRQTREFRPASIRGGELERQLLAYPATPDDCADVAAFALQFGPPSPARQRPPAWDELSFAEQAELRHEELARRRRCILGPWGGP